MSTIHFDSDVLQIPPWICDLESFRRWATSDESPERGRLFFFEGEIWIDMTREQFFTHVGLKQEFFVVLGGIAKSEKLGTFCPDGLLVSNQAADLSGNPDGTFFSNESYRAGLVRLIEGAEQGFIELEGSPDMVLEVVSDSSVLKDTVTLRKLYFKAGIREYWLVDARGERLEFDILRRAARGFSSTRKVDGWMKSTVFGQSFRLTRSVNPLGHPEFNLEAKK